MICPHFLKHNFRNIVIQYQLFLFCPRRQSKLLAIHGSTFTRYAHVKERQRSDVPSNIDEFDKRDKTEMEVGISNAIALADETISNNDITISQLCEQSLTTVQKWMQESGIRRK